MTITTATDSPASDPLAGARVVIAHDNLRWYGGAERIAAIIAEAFPDADFWTVFGGSEAAERMGVADRLRTLLPTNRAMIRAYRVLAPAYPAVIRSRPLPDADLLLTSSFAFAHHFRTRNRAPQLCYCYSPLRAAWTMTEDYAAELGRGRAGAALARVTARGLRRIDWRAAQRVSRYVAESRYVGRQIEEFYERPAEVIYPPVDCDLFRPSGQPGHDGYFLFCGRLVEAYKRPSLVVRAFRDLPQHRLVVAGDGPALSRLQAEATANVTFLGQVGDADLVPLMQRCAAVVFPSRDDFGLIPVEAMACGRPALAYAAGGALETVVAGRTGEFFDEQSPGAIRDAVERFEPDSYDSDAIRAHALGWRRERFTSEIRAAAARTLLAS
jgi:glycosyltransferase involved in cell wall biosynthesis